MAPDGETRILGDQFNGPVTSAEDSPRNVYATLTERIPLYALAALTVAAIGLCIVLAWPFLPAITWGVALAIIAWPMHRWIRNRVRRPRLAAVLSTLAVVLVILVPLAFVTSQLMAEAASAANRAQEAAGGGNLRQSIDGVPGLSRVAQWMDQANLDIETEIRKFLASFLRDFSGLVQGSLAALLQFLVAIFILHYLFVDKAEFLHGLRDLLPLSRSECDRILARAADSVHANLYASVITSLIDTAGGIAMFWLLGLPSPFLWGVVMFVLCLLPIVGATMVWIPAAVFLLLSGKWPHAAALVTWGITTSIVVDNLLYAKLSGKRMRMHEVPALLAFLGGLAIFGMSGVILGPAILAVTIALLEVWRRRQSDAKCDVEETAA